MARQLSILITLALGLAVWGEPAHAADEAAALARAETLVEAAHGALTSEGSDAERLGRLEAALEESFDFDIWERFLIDQHRELFTPEQLTEFRGLLPGFLADLYATQFGKGLEAKPEIVEARRARKDVLVRAGIPRADGRTLPVDWRIREADGEHRVIDVMVGGTSFLILKRDEFDGLIAQGGPARLLSFMRENSV
ncbi:MAG: ABC transporter substrate-binding protein [Pseudomonadota bacterium]